MVMDMNKKLFIFELCGFVFVSVLGTLCHFFFEWSNESTAVGIFCPVNESVWEHLKLLFFPYIIWSITEFFALKIKGNFFFSKLCGSISGMLTILFIHYTYKGASGMESMVADIISFFAGVAVSFLISYAIIKNVKQGSMFREIASAAALIAIAGLFILFTFAPPLIPLFEDPKTLTYGI